MEKYKINNLEIITIVDNKKLAIYFSGEYNDKELFDLSLYLSSFITKKIKNITINIKEFKKYNYYFDESFFNFIKKLKDKIEIDFIYNSGKDWQIKMLNKFRGSNL